MDKNTATTIFESLSSGVRLDVFRLLVKKGFDGMVAGEIAATLILTRIGDDHRALVAEPLK